MDLSEASVCAPKPSCLLSLHRPTDTDAGTPVVGGTTIFFGSRMEAHRSETPRLPENDMQDGGWTFPRHQRRARRRQRSLSLNRVVQQTQRNSGELPTDKYKVQNNNFETLGESLSGDGLATHAGGREGTRHGEGWGRPYMRRVRQQGGQDAPAPKRALDADTRKSAKNIFNLIRTVHHKSVIEEARDTGLYPRGMIKQVSRLSSFIKPAVPTEQVRRQLDQNTDSWMSKNLDILYDHYATVIESLKETRKTEVSFQVAKTWAFKRYGTRLRVSTMSTVETLLKSSGEEGGGGARSEAGHTREQNTVQRGGRSGVMPIDLRDDNEFPPLPTVVKNQTASSSNIQNVSYQKNLSLGKRKTSVEELNELQTVNARAPATAGALPKGRNGDGGKTGEGGSRVETTARIRSNVVVDLDETDDILPASLCSPPVRPRNIVRCDLPLTAANRLTSEPATPSVSCSTSRAGDRTNGPDPIMKQQKRVKIQTSAKTGDKVVGEMTIEALQQQEPAGNLSSDSLDRTDPHYYNIKSNFHLNEEDNESEGSVAEFKTVRQIKQRESHSGRGLTGKGEPVGAEAETRGAEGGYHTPTYHRARPSRKLQDWRIKVDKPVVFLGDSNLNRIPPFENDQIQVESYPGANFYHFFNLLEMTPVCEIAEMVILSVGLNNKDQDPQKTSIKQLRKVVNGAKAVFPNADIFVAHIHFSRSLSKLQQSNLTMINNFISTHYNYLPCIPQQYFHTTADGIHWTSETAKSIFDSWCEGLRLSVGLTM